MTNTHERFIVSFSAGLAGGRYTETTAPIAMKYNEEVEVLKIDIEAVNSLQQSYGILGTKSLPELVSFMDALLWQLKSAGI